MKNINEELNRMKNLIDYKSGNVLEEQNILKRIFGKNDKKTEEGDNTCKGVTADTPPSDFKTKYVNNSTDLYFYGVSRYKDDGDMVNGEYIQSNKEKHENDCWVSASKQISFSLFSDASPIPFTPIAGDLSKRKIKIDQEFRMNLNPLVLIKTVLCHNNKDKYITQWHVYKFPVTEYNKILENLKELAKAKLTDTEKLVTSPVEKKPEIPDTEKPKTSATEKPVSTNTTQPEKVTHRYPNDKSLDLFSGVAKSIAANLA